MAVSDKENLYFGAFDQVTARSDKDNFLQVKSNMVYGNYYSTTAVDSISSLFLIGREFGKAAMNLIFPKREHDQLFCMSKRMYR